MMLIAALCSIALLSAPACAGEARLAKETAAVVDDLVHQATLSGHKVAVGAFGDSDGRHTQLSALLSENVELALVGKAARGGYQMMDRRNVGELVKEWELSVNGQVDDDNLIHAGRLIGAQVLCLGKYTKIGRRVTLRVTLVGSEKGEILAASSAELELDSDLREMSEKVLPPERPKAEAAAASTETLKVELWTEKTSYAAGDKLVVHARVNRDGYLTIVDVGAGGKASILYPNLYAPSNAVKAGVEYLIPDAAAGFEFEVAPPAGVELIRAIASKEPSVDLKDVMNAPSADAPFSAVKEDVAVLTRDIHVKAKKAKPGDWSESVIKLSIR
jgi:hypothetical protein